MEPKDQARNYPNTNKIWFFSLVFFVFSYLALPVIGSYLLGNFEPYWQQFGSHLLRIGLFIPLFWKILPLFRWSFRPLVILSALLSGALLSFVLSRISPSGQIDASPLLIINFLLGTSLEELFFRGVFVFGWTEIEKAEPRGYLVFWIASSCLFFAFAHALPHEPLFWITLAFGAGLFFLTKKTGSILPALFLHLSYNLTLIWFVQLL